MHKLAIIGLGYVGLPLFLELNKFYTVLGYDNNNKRIETLKNRKDLNKENNITKSKKNILLTNDFSKLKNSNIFILALPTPVTKKNIPDISILKKVCKKISKILKKNDLIIFESTVFPGTTRNTLIPILESETKLKHNIDFGVSYSPERINPGDNSKNIQNIKKIVSSSNSKYLKRTSSIYRKIIRAGIHEASSIEIAEASKIIENVQRDVNIALINEFNIAMNNLGIDTNKVLNAASTKWNFINFRPGLVGGHCIGVDSYYYLSSLRKKNINTHLVEEARKINESVPIYYFKMINKISKEKGFNLKKNKSLILGYSFKENCADIRNTKVEKIRKLFVKNKMFVDVYDPIIDIKTVKKVYGFYPLKNIKIKYDIIIIAVSHNKFAKNFNLLKTYSKKNSLIFDLKNTYDGKKEIINI